MAEGIAARVVRDRDLGRELAQEAMLQAYLSLDRLRNDARFQSWLYGIVLNVCKSHLRFLRGAPVSLEGTTGGLQFEALPFSSAAADPHEVAEAQELHEAVLQAVDSLPAKTRSAVMLYYYDQLTVRELSAILGISVAAVKGRLHRARKGLRARLSPVASELGYSRPHSAEERKMVQVTIADVISRENRDLEAGRQVTVVLLDDKGKRVLPIWVGPSEGHAIAVALRDFRWPRPQTHDLMSSMLNATGAEVDEVRVEELREDTFYAVIVIRAAGKSTEVDARPSDAFALAVRTGCPIFVAEEVMEQSGRRIPEGFSTEPLGAGMDSIVAISEGMASSGSRGLPKPSEEEVERACEEFWEELFGSEAQ